MTKPRHLSHTERPVTADDQYVLHLYVTGATPNSLRAISNIKSICKSRLKDRVTLKITDVYLHREQAELEQIVALPMLLKIHPSPQRRLIGDLSNTVKVLELLGLNEL